MPPPPNGYTTGMRTLAIVAAIIAVAAVILGLILEALWWLIVVGLVGLAIALVAGWAGTRHANRTDHKRHAG